MPSGRTNNFPESGRGLGHVTPAIFGSTVGYPSDSLASCSARFSKHHYKTSQVALCADLSWWTYRSHWMKAAVTRVSADCPSWHF